MKHKVVDHFRRIARTAQFQVAVGGDEECDCFEKSGPLQGRWREDRAPLNWPYSATQTLESQEFWKTFDNCLSRLPQQMAIAFTLREIDGLKSDEICEVLNITPNNLWVILHRSRAKLRHLLETEWCSHHAAAA